MPGRRRKTKVVRAIKIMKLHSMRGWQGVLGYIVNKGQNNNVLRLNVLVVQYVAFGSALSCGSASAVLNSMKLY